MSTLSINTDILGQFSDDTLCLFFLSISFSFLLFLKSSLSQKNDDRRLIHRWIIMKFEHQGEIVALSHRWKLRQNL